MPDIVSRLQSKLKASDTVERCGLVLTGGRVKEVTNHHQKPETGFSIPAEDLHTNLKKLIGTWHTHLDNDSALSQEDYLGFSQWPGITHYIVSSSGVRAYLASEQGIITEINLASD